MLLTTPSVHRHRPLPTMKTTDRLITSQAFSSVTYIWQCLRSYWFQHRGSRRHTRRRLMRGKSDNDNDDDDEDWGRMVYILNYTTRLVLSTVHRITQNSMYYLAYYNHFIQPLHGCFPSFSPFTNFNTFIHLPWFHSFFLLYLLPPLPSSPHFTLLPFTYVRPLIYTPYAATHQSNPSFTSFPFLIYLFIFFKSSASHSRTTSELVNPHSYQSQPYIESIASPPLSPPTLQSLSFLSILSFL